MRNTIKLIKSDERGFTLLEVLVAGAIGVVVAFSVARVAIDAANAQRSSQLDLLNVAMSSRLQNAIDDPILCSSVWSTWNTVSSAFDVAKFDPTGATPTVTIDRLVDGAPTDIVRTSGPAGGPSVGLTFPSITFTEPFQVSDNTYDWTLTMKTSKILPDGTELGTSLRRIRLEVTTNGSPNYAATSCGPPVSPQANQQIQMLRFTSGTVPGDSTDATLDGACAGEFTALYSAASLQDLIPYKMILYHNFGAGGDGGFLNGFNFIVADLQPKVIFSNAIDPAVTTRPPGTVYAVKAGVAGDTPHVACVRNTAPMRFVRGFYKTTDALNTPAVSKTTLCQTNLGFAYSAAGINDLMRFGFRPADGAVGGGHMDPGAPGAVFDGPAVGTGVACRIGWDDTGAGSPGIDCTVAGDYPIACVLR